MSRRGRFIVVGTRPLGESVDFRFHRRDRDIVLPLVVSFRVDRFIPATREQPAEGGFAEIRTIWLERLVRGVKSWRYLGSELESSVEQGRLQALLDGRYGVGS